MRDLGHETTQTEPPSCLEGADLVVAAFGRWPSFHDAEVLRIELSREHEPRIAVDVLTWLMSDETDERGYFRHEHTSIVSFLFERVTNVELQGFNQQNVISGIFIREDGDGIAVDFDPCFGVDARWRCEAATVMRVSPI